MFEQQMFWHSVFLYLLWVLGPLIPAVLIYWSFRHTDVKVSGPLAGFKVQAGGAFAIYLVVFLGAYPLTQRQQDVLSAALKPFWTLKAEVIANDADGNPIRYSNFYNGMSVSFSPEIQVVSGREVSLKVPMDGSGQRWPKITFQVPNYGGVTIDPAKYTRRMEIDHFSREVRIDGAIPLERFVPAAFGIGSAPPVPGEPK